MRLLILALVKREIAKRPHKTLFIDGFPRDMDQVSYSLFFRDLVGFRDDADVMAFIDVPTAVIEERIKYRRICPICNTSRNTKLFPTARVDYDEKLEEFHLICDNPDCSGNGRQRMVGKEGDNLGIEPIRERLEIDQKLMEKAMTLHGLPKIFLRNSVPVDAAKNYVDDYELTMAYDYEWDAAAKKINIIEKPWVVNGKLKVRSVCELTLSFDHRVCDLVDADVALAVPRHCFHRSLPALCLR